MGGTATVRHHYNGIGMARLTILSVVLAWMTISTPGVTAQVFRSTAETVQLPVVVLNKAGQTVSGLKAEDFVVFENGQPQQIVSFAEGAPGARVPLHLGLMLDRSESMELDMKTAADAAVRFVSNVDEADDVTFVEFSTQIQVGRYSPNSYPQLFERIRTGKIGQQTALYDAVNRYIETTLDRVGQHVLLVYTDGGDSVSRTTIAQLQGMLRLGRAMVYVVGYLENQSSSERTRQRALLTQLSHETGGEAFFPTSARELTQVYTLGYSSTDPRQDGRFRRVEVRLRQTPSPDVRVRTRSGYLASAADVGR
jgi:VWFA-related protein